MLILLFSHLSIMSILHSITHPYNPKLNFHSSSTALAIPSSTTKSPFPCMLSYSFLKTRLWSPLRLHVLLSSYRQFYNFKFYVVHVIGLNTELNKQVVIEGYFLYTGISDQLVAIYILSCERRNWTTFCLQKQKAGAISEAPPRLHLFASNKVRISAFLA